MEDKELNVTGENEFSLNKAVLERLLDIVVTIASYKANKRAKVPSVTITQEQALELIDKVGGITMLLGHAISIAPSEDEPGAVAISIAPLYQEQAEPVEEAAVDA